MESTLINNLLDPACYPHEVSELKLIETHIAWLITTGDYVYKIKKPVNFGFLDFTTLEQRKFFCEEELRLNQRMSSDLYLEVVSIGGPENSPHIGQTDHPIEYAVKLRQFEGGQLLSELLTKDQFDPSWLEQLADKIADFHARAPIVSPDSRWGEADSIKQLAEDNYQQINQSLLSPAQQQNFPASNRSVLSASVRLSICSKHANEMDSCANAMATFTWAISL